MALVVCQKLAHLATTTGLTVVTSIHQPSAQAFGCFGQLLLLKRGAIVYRGPTDAAAGYFATQFNRPCPEIFGSAEWMIELLVSDAYGIVNDDRLTETFGPS